jgi:hypothetical protein
MWGVCWIVTVTEGPLLEVAGAGLQNNLQGAGFIQSQCLCHLKKYWRKPNEATQKGSSSTGARIRIISIQFRNSMFFLKVLCKFLNRQQK